MGAHRPARRQIEPVADAASASASPPEEPRRLAALHGFELRRGDDPSTAAILPSATRGRASRAASPSTTPARASLGMRFVTALVGPGNLRVDEADRRRIVARLA